MRHLLALLLVLTATACATSAGFDRGALHNQVAEQTIVTEDDIRKALDAKPQLPSPFRLAIHFVPSANPQGYWHHAGWQWLHEDKQVLLDAAAALRSSGVVSDAFVIDAGTIEGTDNRAIRLAAARAGADAVLVVRGSGSTDRYNNPLGITYVLILTAFFVPGTQTDALFMSSASLWDVRNQYLYLSAEAEGTAGQTRPAFFAHEDVALAEAKLDALHALTKSIAARVATMK